MPSLSITQPLAFPSPDGERDSTSRVDLPPVFWVGRSSLCNLVVTDDDSVSRLHAILEREGSRYTLTDMKSLNGTWVNGKSIRRTVLAEGDKISISLTKLVFSESNIEQPVKNAQAFHLGTLGSIYRIFPSDSLDQTLMKESCATPGDKTAERVHLDFFLRVALDRVIHVLQADLAIVFLIDPRDGSPIPSAVRGIRDGLFTDLPLPEEAPLFLEDVAGAKVVTEDPGPRSIGKVLRQTLTLKLPDWVAKPAKPAPRVRIRNSDSWRLTVPIGVPDAPLGWLGVQRRLTMSPDALPFRPDDEGLLEEVAGGLGAAIVRFQDPGRR